jgi:hypothetical protein
MAKTVRYTKNTLALDIMIKGIGALESALSSQRASWDTAKSAHKLMVEAGHILAGAVEDWIEENQPEKAATGAARGRTLPKPGDMRSYKAQQVKGVTGLYIRLPVDALCSAKGDLVTVTFGTDGIFVARAQGTTQVTPQGTPQVAEAEDDIEPTNEAPAYTPEDLLNFDRPKTRLRKRSA